MTKPRVLTKCVANHYAGTDERIIEFSFDTGDGGLINFRKLEDGTPIVSLYRLDPGIKVFVAKEALGEIN